jgi:hypothetical protein
MSVAKNIRLYLVENSITQKWLSMKTGIDYEKICLSLNENRKLDVEEFAKILAALNEPAERFIKSD